MSYLKDVPRRAKNGFRTLSNVYKEAIGRKVSRGDSKRTLVRSNVPRRRLK
jgi:hypothetical protein